MDHFDVIVIGSGTAGYTVAKGCRTAGLSVAVVERALPGGTCALRGCQPKKFFAVQAELARTLQHLAGKGVVRQPELSWAQTERFKRDFTDAVPAGTTGFFDRIGARFISGSAEITAPRVVRVGDTDLQAGVVVLATGARPRGLAIPGAELALDSAGFLGLTELPDTVTFVGGGYISFEFAHMAAAYGSRVTILNRSDRVLRGFDRELAASAVAAARDAGITIRTGVEPSAIATGPAGLRVRCSDGEDCPAEIVVTAIGREAEFAGLGLEAIGVRPDPGGLEIDGQMRVAGHDWLFAVGDCARSPALAPVADREARVAAQVIAGEDLTMDYRIVPSVCFAQPPVAGVGLSEDEAEASGRLSTIKRGETTSWANQRRLGATRGTYKVLIDERERVMGAHIMGHEAGDIINLFALLMLADLPASALREVMWAYPTLTSDVKYMV